jgi:hypothetical protein
MPIPSFLHFFAAFGAQKDQKETGLLNYTPYEKKLKTFIPTFNTPKQSEEFIYHTAAMGFCYFNCTFTVQTAESAGLTYQ